MLLHNPKLVFQPASERASKRVSSVCAKVDHVWNVWAALSVYCTFASCDALLLSGIH